MKRSLLLSLCAVAIVAMSLGQAMAAISLSLKLRYNDPNSTAAGGTWDLMAKTDNPNGIAGLAVVLDNITFGETTFNSAIAGIPIETSQSGTLTEIVWGYDVNATAGVGKFLGVGNTLALVNDTLMGGNAAYNGMSRIMSGEFGSVRPSFGSLPGTGGGPTAGQEWSSAAMTSGGAELEVGNGITLMGNLGVRGDSVSIDGLKPGDANRDGTVNGLDFSILASPANFGQSGKNWDTGDFDSNGTVNGLDFSILASPANFGQTAPSPAITAVPEPSSLLVLACGVLSLAGLRRRS